MLIKPEIRLVHLADLHLGYTGNLLFNADEPEAGRLVREVDLHEAVRKMVSRIVNAKPSVDLVVIAGDLFHNSVPRPRAIDTAARMVRKLVDSGIEVVIIDGNHETTGDLKNGSATTFLEAFGAHVINDLTSEIIQGESWNNPKLQNNLIVTALPYRAVMTQDFTGIGPTSGYLNVLVTHGSVQNMDELNTLRQKTFRLPSSLLERGWDYIALGDWHIHGHQPLPGVPAYYAGSLEAINFGEAAFYPTNPEDKYAVRGGLDVILNPNQKAKVVTLPHEPRPVLRLHPIDASELTANALMNEIRQRLQQDLPTESLVHLEVTNCTIPVYSDLNQSELAALRKRVRHCGLSFKDWATTDIEQANESLSKASPLERWKTFVEEVNTDKSNQEWYLERGQELITGAQQSLHSVNAANEI